MIVLGIMNGTSGDGVDYVLSQIDIKKKTTLRFLQHVHKPFDADFHERTKKILLNQTTTYGVGEYHYELGRMYAEHFAKIKFVKKPQLIGMHGQTVYHRGQHATLQLGEPSFLAQQARVPVIFNFRARDIAAGGHGAPLAPVFHRVLLSEFKKPVAFHNLGGISNLTYYDKKKWLAFDTGPASTLIDTWIQHKTNGQKLFDDRGAEAARGLPHIDSLKKMLAFEYFEKKAPKSCGREEFNLDFIHAHIERKFHKLPLADQLATLTELSAQTIFAAYQKFCPSMPAAIYFSGGGLHNDFLMQRLKIHLGAERVLSSEDLGWPTQAIEGGAFALLAFLRWQKKSIDLSTITGGNTKSLLGQICEV